MTKVLPAQANEKMFQCFALSDKIKIGAVIKQEKYTLRYSGGLVPDVFHALVKGHGIYTSPVTEKSPAKLRRLYELTPVALLIECAGGTALDSKDGSRILDTPVRDTDERGGLVCGNKEDVEFVRKRLLEG